MLTLGIETSCDETSAAVVEDVGVIRSNIVSSQVPLHAGYGGVVPELAARAHVERLPLVVDEALARAGCAVDDVGLVAVTRGPGLIGALLVGVGFAQAMALERRLSIVGVGHLDGHLHSAYLVAPDLELPMLVLIVSGGHTELVLVPEPGRSEQLGQTRDDAAGEAYDKVARMLGLGYPGGPEIDRLADGVDVASALEAFPLPRIEMAALDFSFSGIKTAVRYSLERRLGLSQGALDAEASARLGPDLVQAAATAFQHRVVEHLTDKALRAAREHHPRTVAVVGGVASNRALRGEMARVFEQAAQRGGATTATRLVVPPAELCTDNAAMIAAAGYQLWQRGRGADLTVDPSLRLAEVSPA